VSDYDTNPNQIIYDNINGYAISQGISTNIDFNFPNGLKIITGASLLDKKNVENNRKETPF
jgi:outer membrane receptor for ferrienterochelin and colicins